MGVRNLYKFLRQHYPAIFQTVHLSDYQHKKITIDTMNYMYKIMATEARNGRMQDSYWIQRFIALALTFRKFQIHTCFVFDGEAPQIKTNTQEKRVQDRQKQRSNISTTIQDLDAYRETGEVSETLASFFKRQKAQDILGQVNTTGMDELLQSRQNQLDITVNAEKVKLLKEAFDVFEIPYLQAKGEGEELCCQLVREGKAAAVLSEDSDCLAYGSSEVLIGLDTLQFTATRICYADVLDALEMTPEMFTDFCILCGLDYNDTIPKVGIVSAFDLIHHYKTIDKIPHDVECLNHTLMREMMSVDNASKTQVPLFPTDPNWENISTYLFHNSINLSLDFIESHYTELEIDFL